MSKAQSKSHYFAAVDLGSNSFHLVVVRYQNGRVQIIDQHREMVRLATNMSIATNQHPTISVATEARALNCLGRFAQRLAPFKEHRVRVVGTSALRKASNKRHFLDQANAVLQQEIEVISGQEEARLIYIGVTHSMVASDHNRLVVDIGGGSTELIIGKGFAPKSMVSIDYGCVSMSEKFFADSLAPCQQMQNAQLEILRQLEPLKQQFSAPNWELAIGSSGTVNSILNILREHNWGSNTITATGMHKLKAKIATLPQITQQNLPGVSADRAAVLRGGIAILDSLFQALKIDHLLVSSGALREGVLHDLIGRTEHRDTREHTVKNLVKQYHIDVTHARSVCRTALHILRKISPKLLLNKQNHWQKLISWATMLHEIGLSIAYANHHRHGQYLLENIDMPGFSIIDQKRLAILIGSQCQKIPKNLFRHMSTHDLIPLNYLLLILRLAIILQRNRNNNPIPLWRFKVQPDNFSIELPEGWLDNHMLTRMDLEKEAMYRKNSELSISIKEYA